MDEPPDENKSEFPKIESKTDPKHRTEFEKSLRRSEYGKHAPFSTDFRKSKLESKVNIPKLDTKSKSDLKSWMSTKSKTSLKDQKSNTTIRTTSKTRNESKNVNLSTRIDTADDIFIDIKSDEDLLEQQINLCLSDTKLDDLYIKRKFTDKLITCMGVIRQMDKAEFEDYAKRLYKCCLKSVRDLHELHLRRELGVRLLNEIVLRANPLYISIPHVIHMIWSTMSCLHHFQLRLRAGTTGLIYYARKKKSEACMATYIDLIKIFRPEIHRIILNSIITFYREGRLWEVDFTCTELIVALLQTYPEPEEGILDMICTIEISTLINIHEAKYLNQILYNVLKKVRWRYLSEMLLMKFLSMLEGSIVPKATDNYNYFPLRKGLEICVRNIIGNLGYKALIKLIYFTLKRMKDPTLQEEVVVCFGNMASYAAKRCRMRTSVRDLSHGPFPLIFGLFFTESSTIFLLGARIWQNILDRNQNAKNFYTPKIFFQDCDYHLVIKKCVESEKYFIKKVRTVIYNISMGLFTNSLTRINLENAFQAAAITLVEVPCGYSASCYVTLAMNLQDFAFKICKDDLVRSHHIHAVVLSMLTLICYIHDAKVFYNYVNTIMERRAEWAPHLNPPLKPSYEYAQHHVLWNKPELFFEDWEARYGLWKCFRVKNKTNLKSV